MPDDTADLTIVLVHGAFADASSWNGVVERLQASGLRVTAPANPLRGIAIDSAYLASALEQIPGPVLAVGYSYGGAVISNAATGAANVVGLVFVAAFAPDEGERLGEVESGSRDGVLNSALVPLRYPTGDGGQTATEFAIDPAKFRDAFAADLPPEQTSLMAATQRPIAEAAFSELSGPSAWKSLPAWAVVATGDKAAGADIVLHGRASRSHHHRGRRLARDHGVPPRTRHRGHQDRRRREVGAGPASGAGPLRAARFRNTGTSREGSS